MLEKECGEFVCLKQQIQQQNEERNAQIGEDYQERNKE